MTGDGSTPHVRLVDEPDRSGRTTATLLASLRTRLAILNLASGADVIGSLASGYAALGREVSATAEGSRMRDALAAGRAGANGDALWASLLIDRWSSSLPPSPVLQHLRNDLALLLVDDLDETLELPPLAPEPVGGDGGPVDEPSTSLDFLVGVWAFSRELAAGVEALAEPTLPPAGRVEPGRTPPPTLEPPVLR